MSYSYPLRTPWGLKGAVVLLHIALILAIGAAHHEKIPTILPKSLVVQTIVLESKPIPAPTAPPIKQPIRAPEPVIAEPVIAEKPAPPLDPPLDTHQIPEPQISAPQKKAVKKEPPKPAVKKKKPVALPKKQTKKPPTATQKNSQKTAQKKLEEKKASMLREALSSLNRVEKHAPSTKTAAVTVSAPKIGSLSAENMTPSASSAKEAKAPSYHDELVQRLKLALQLPEYGEVKLELTLNRSGKVVKLKCVQAKSRKNANYLEKMIPSVTFPPFGHNFTNEKQHTFRLRLSEDILIY
jgi:colicin import membrane protein